MSNVSTINTALILQRITQKEERFVSLIVIFDINYPKLLEIRKCLNHCIIQEI